MDDFFDDFGDDFSDDFSENGDSFEDAFDDDFGPEDSLNEDAGIEEEPSGNNMCDDEFTANEATMFGVAMGFAYEEGLEERKRRRIERKMNKDNDQDDL